MSDFGKTIIAVLGALALLGGLTYAGCAGYPEYKVWSAGKDGEAELMKAQQNRQIKVLEAQAELDSAKLKAQSEIERAKGVAEANKIVAEGLKGNEEYLRYLWIDKVAGGNVAREVIYVPTEANLPILEAGKR
jgi:regulator of protease activity HflC (stomatin/prohibitin superfamily)